MSSRKGAANPSSAAFGDGMDQLSTAVSDISVNSPEDDGWQEYGKKSKNKNKSNASKQWGAQHSSSKAWSSSDTVQKLGLQSPRGFGRGSGQMRPTLSSDPSEHHHGRGFTKPPLANQPAGIPPPLKNVWAARAASTQAPVHPANNQASTVDEVDDSGEESDDVDDSDDELLSDGFDSDESKKSHETRKKNGWFEELFQCLDELKVDEINDPERQWHCPACKGGPGAIDWYPGLLPLITHAKTIRSKRVKLHRELAELLDEELKRKGTSAVPAGESFGKWKGLEEMSDREIVWPPMVIIMNTRLDKDDNEKWIGMGNQELLDYFRSYSPLKARHSYGPQGHRGMSVLIFEASAVGYAEADRLSKHFEDNFRDRVAWGRNRVAVFSEGNCQLYGYMAEKQDMDIFNQHSQGKSKLKYELRSYLEMVVNQMKQMSEDNQQLIWLKNKIAKEQKNKKALEESFGFVAEKSRRTMQENHVMKLKTKTHHEQNKEEMDSQEQFFREQIQQFYDDRNAKEEQFERLQQYEREKKVTQSDANVSSGEERLRRAEEFIKVQDKEMEEYVKKKERLMKAHEERMRELKRRQREEELALEKEFDAEFNKLMEEYAPK